MCVAQDTTPPPAQDLLQQRYEELTLWLEAYTEWEAWVDKWGNRIAYNSAGGMIKKRPVRPEPPHWLFEDCRSVIAAEGKLAEACQIVESWQGLGSLMLGEKRFGRRTTTDVEPKSSFLQRVHFSGGWVPAQLPAPKVYLVAGMQVGIVEIGRLTLPAVGVGLMAVANGSGGYDWKPATVIGIGYRLSSFGFPWINREANLHINIARATIHAARNMPIGLDPSQNLIGFSLTFAKR